MIELVPLMAGAAIVPFYSIAALILLQSPDGLLKAAAFVSGGIAVRLAQGIAFGLILVAACEANPEPGPRLIVSTLQLTIGILLLVTAIKQWRSDYDPDLPPPKWFSTIAGFSAIKAFGAGAFFVTIAVKQWVFTLSAISVVSQAELSVASEICAYLVFVLATQALVLAPILASAVAPRSTAKPLKAIQTWLERNNRSIMILMSLIFGGWFLFKGITGLIP